MLEWPIWRWTPRKLLLANTASRKVIKKMFRSDIIEDAQHYCPSCGRNRAPQVDLYCPAGRAGERHRGHGLWVLPGRFQSPAPPNHRLGQTSDIGGGGGASDQAALELMEATDETEHRQDPDHPRR